MEHRVLRGVFCLLLAFQCAQSELVNPPQNEAVVVTSTIVLTCEAHAPSPETRVMWGEYVSNANFITPISDEEYILAHPNQANYRIIHNTTSSYHLEISNIRYEDAGRYLCRDTRSAPPFRYQGEMELIVVDQSPICDTTAPPGNQVLEGQTYTIECRLFYGGLFAPQMSWSGPPPFEVGNPPPTPGMIWSGVQYTVNRTMDLRAFECLTNISNVPEQPDGTADNTPTWSHLYRAQQMFVYWGPKNTFASPMQPTYEVGDDITCTSDAKPEASYFWQNMLTLAMIYNRTFTVTPGMVGFNTTMRCMAQNIIGGFVYSDNIFIQVYVPAPTTPPITTPTTPTTTPLPSEDCRDLTGHWLANNPRAELVLDVMPGGQAGEVTGLMKNGTDTVWVEVVGTTRKPDFAFLGLASVWPFNDGVTGFSGECHQCNGVELIMGNGMWRSRKDSLLCGHGGTPYPYDLFYFYRSGSVRDALDDVELDVYKPTDISERLGVTLKKKK